MAKGKKKKDIVDEILKDEREFIIKGATIKDGFCHYSFEPLKGFAKGDQVNVKGAALVHADMSKALNKLNVHLAHIDDAFKAAEIEIDDIDEFHKHDLTDLFLVNGFKIKGSTEDEKVILIGSKYVSAGGRIDLETPPILIAEFSPYKWWNELKAAVDKVRQEVEAYMHGKCTPVEEEEEAADPKQTKIQFAQPAAAEAEMEGATAVININDEDFKNAKV